VIMQSNTLQMLTQKTAHALTLLDTLFVWSLVDEEGNWSRRLIGTHKVTGDHVVSIDDDGLYLIGKENLLQYVSTPQIDQWAKDLFLNTCASHDLQTLITTLEALR